MTRCDSCGKGILTEKEVSYSVLGRKLGTFRALVCATCNETIFSGQTFIDIEAKAKEAGVWGVAVALGLYRSGACSLDKAAKKVGITMREMMQEAAKAGITSTETVEEYRRGLQILLD